MRLGANLLLLAPLGAPILKPNLESKGGMGFMSYVLQAGYCICIKFRPSCSYVLRSRSIQLMGVVIENAPLISF